MTNYPVPDSLEGMEREFSAGGVVLRRMQGKSWIAAIEPRRESSTDDKKRQSQSKSPVIALPKGLVDAGEQPEQTAIREVREETGVEATPITKLKDIRYFYVRSWSDRQRVFKIVSFYLLQYRSGRIGDITESMKIEVERAFWLPLEEAALKLSYRGEKDVVKVAEQYLQTHPEV